MPLFEDANDIIINGEERIKVVGATLTKTKNPTAWIKKMYTLTFTATPTNVTTLDFSTVPVYASINAAEIDTSLAAGKLFKLADNNVNGFPKQMLFVK